MAHTARAARLAVVGAAIGLAAIPWPAPVVERWTAAYFRLQPFVTDWSNRVPFALLDVLIVTVLAASVVSWIRRVTAAGRGARGRAIAVALGHTVVLAAALVLWFLALWGLHYRQPPVTSRFDIDRGRVDAAAVERLAMKAARELNRLAADAHRSSPRSTRALVDRLRPVFVRTMPALGVPATIVVGEPKPTVLAPFFRWASVAGLTDPFFLEVMMTPEALPFEQPAILAHEWSHLAGFARESDASFVAFVVCQRGNAEDRYSAWLDLFLRARAQLPPNARRLADASLDAGVRADISAVAARLRRAVPAVRDAAWRGYDTYLKTQRVERGVEDYDDVVVLVAGATFDREGLPRRRGTEGGFIPRGTEKPGPQRHRGTEKGH